MVELRPRRAKAAPADAAKAEGTPIKPKTPKASKRKATEDVSPTATKKAKAEETEEPITEQVKPTPKLKKGKTPVKAKDISTGVEETPVPKSSKKTKTPAKSKDVEAITPQGVADTPAPKSAKKTKTPAKVNAKETIAPQEALETPVPKSSKKTKTPAKSKDVEAVIPQEVADTPAPKSSKKTKTPAKAKEIATVVTQVAEKTPISKSKKDPTPAKEKDAANPLVQETPIQEPEKTPASKSKKAKTPVNSANSESTAAQEKKSASKEKTPSKAEGGEEAVPKETDQTPATKSKKNKTPAKANSVKETPSKAAQQPVPTTTEKTPAKSADQEMSAPKSTKKTPKSAKKSAKKSEPVPEDTVEEAKDAAPREDAIAFSDEELDEQTKDLIKAVDAEEDDGAQAGVVLFEEGQDVGKIPEISKKQQKKAQKQLAAGSSAVKEETAVIYVGRLPHGFYEREMRSYFSQFGPIRNLRVARNKLTGKAKHFAFAEFEEASTAEIVAKTMNNYLLFGHILKCSVIPKDQIHDELFKGANKRFKPVPWNKMEGKHMQRPLIEDKWSRKIAKENKRRADRAGKLGALGYEYSAPELLAVDAAKAIAAAAPVAEDQTVEATEDSATKAIEAPSAAETAAVETAVVEGAKEAEAEETPKPAKRGRGRPPKGAAAESTPNKRVKRTKA
ncbi:unnamed protein product [Discula destructiva]